MSSTRQIADYACRECMSGPRELITDNEAAAMLAEVRSGSLLSYFVRWTCDTREGRDEAILRN